jgi:hypothetical protein
MSVSQGRGCFIKGCVMPFAILLLIYVTWLFMAARKTYYVSDLCSNVRIERYPFKKARIYFSKTKTFGDDYIEYQWYPDGPGIDIYYIEPNMFYVIDEGNIIAIRYKHYHITEIQNTFGENTGTTDSSNWYLKHYIREWRDSFFIKNSYAKISVWGTQWLNIYNSKHQLIFHGN